MVNKAILVGAIGKDPETKTFDNGGKIIKFPLATSEKYFRDGEWHENTTWHNIDFPSKFDRTLKKGDTVYVEGSIKTREYTDDDGNTRKITFIRAQKVSVIKHAKHPAVEEREQAKDASKPESQPDTTGAPLTDDELPF